MSIHFICGKPGGGKSLYAVKLIVEEIIHGGRDVITNVALKLPELNDYLQKEYPKTYQSYIIDSGFTIADRVTVIDEDQMGEFYRFRGRGVILPMLSKEKVDYGATPPHGVMYALDEIHIKFNSRAWAETGKAVLYYLSQHRKLGDDILCITQAVSNVDKQFRSVAQDYTYIRNLSKVRWAFFRFPPIFYRSTYPSAPTDVTKPMVEGTFTLDVKGLAACYDTAKGVGIHGRSGADTKERKKGLPFWVLMTLGAAALLFVLFGVPRILKWYLNPHRVTGQVQKVENSIRSSSGVETNVADSGAGHFFSGLVSPGLRPHPADHQRYGLADVPDGSDKGALPVVSVPLGTSPDQTNEVTCIGYCLFPAGREVCYFSDGSAAYGEDHEIQQVNEHWAVCFGKRFRVVQGSVVSGRVREAVESGVMVGGGLQGQVREAGSGGSVEVLPSINGNWSGLTPPTSLGGISAMAQNNNVPSQR